MRKRWLALPLAIGLSSAAVVWFWPIMPLWHRAVSADVEVLRFGPDGRILYTVDGLIRSADPSTLHVCRWEAATGELLGAVSISHKAKAPRVEMRLSPDACTLLLGDSEALAAVPILRWVWFIFDAKTGQRRGVPVGHVAHFNPDAFSQDGRWFWVYSWDGIDIVDTATGKRVVELRARADEILDCCFSPDGAAAAVHWRKVSGAAACDSVRIIELPGGREIRRFDLPTRPWQRIDEWMGDRLYAEFEVPDRLPGHYLKQSYSFDLTADSIGKGRPEPLLSGQVIEHEGQTYWRNGPGWVAHESLSYREPKKWEEWFEWLALKTGMKFRAERGLVTRVRFLDSDTGRLRYELPRPVNFQCVISSDGKRVACAETDGVVQVWDANPPPRWPWAVAAGLVSAAPILIAGRWRSPNRLAPAKST
jgi:hypothetical protein